MSSLGITQAIEFVEPRRVCAAVLLGTSNTRQQLVSLQTSSLCGWLLNRPDQRRAKIGMIAGDNVEICNGLGHKIGGMSLLRSRPFFAAPKGGALP